MHNRDELWASGQLKRGVDCVCSRLEPCMYHSYKGHGPMSEDKPQLPEVGSRWRHRAGTEVRVTHCSGEYIGWTVLSSGVQAQSPKSDWYERFEPIPADKPALPEVGSRWLFKGRPARHLGPLFVTGLSCGMVCYRFESGWPSYECQRLVDEFLVLCESIPPAPLVATEAVAPAAEPALCDMCGAPEVVSFGYCAACDAILKGGPRPKATGPSCLCAPDPLTGEDVPGHWDARCPQFFLKPPKPDCSCGVIEGDRHSTKCALILWQVKYEPTCTCLKCDECRLKLDKEGGSPLAARYPYLFGDGLKLWYDGVSWVPARGT